MAEPSLIEQNANPEPPKPVVQVYPTEADGRVWALAFREAFEANRFLPYDDNAMEAWFDAAIHAAVMRRLGQ